MRVQAVTLDSKRAYFEIDRMGIGSVRITTPDGTIYHVPTEQISEAILGPVIHQESNHESKSSDD